MAAMSAARHKTRFVPASSRRRSTRRPFTHVTVQQADCSKVALAGLDNPIVAWLDSELSVGPAGYLAKLKAQSRELLAEDPTTFDKAVHNQRFLATLLLADFSVSRGLSLDEVACLLPLAAESAMQAICWLLVVERAENARALRFLTGDSA